MNPSAELPLIVHVIVSLDVGGLENGLINLVNRMPRDRYRQAIVCLKDYTSFRERLRGDDVRVVALHKREGKDVGSYVKLWRLFRTLRPTIVHTRNLGTIDAAFPAKFAGVHALVHGEHGWDVHDVSGANRKYRLLRRACALLVDKEIAVSRHIAAWLERDVRVPAARIAQVYNGVDSAKFRPAENGRASLGPPGFAPPDAFVIGTVGRMAEIKDPVTLARAFVRLREVAGMSRARLRLVMIGDGSQREDVNRALAGDDIHDVVWLPGRRDDIAEILRGLDLFVLPSRNEGISNTILEAMASALPVIATDVGGNPELVAPGKTGTLVPAQDPDAMAAAMLAYFDASQPTKAHGAAGRQRVLEEFSMERMLARYLEIYDSVVGPRRAVGA